MNVTALKLGSTGISLEVLDRGRRLLSSSQVSIRVIPRLSLEVPTYIGEVSKKASQLLLPPRSSLTLGPAMSLHMPCEGSGITVADSTIYSDDSRGGGTVIATDPAGNRMSLSVESAHIFSLFIENGGSGTFIQLSS